MSRLIINCMSLQIHTFRLPSSCRAYNIFPNISFLRYAKHQPLVNSKCLFHPVALDDSFRHGGRTYFDSNDSSLLWRHDERRWHASAHRQFNYAILQIFSIYHTIGHCCVSSCLVPLPANVRRDVDIGDTEQKTSCEDSTTIGSHFAIAPFNIHWM